MAAGGNLDMRPGADRTGRAKSSTGRCTASANVRGDLREKYHYVGILMLNAVFPVSHGQLQIQ